VRERGQRVMQDRAQLDTLRVQIPHRGVGQLVGGRVLLDAVAAPLRYLVVGHRAPHVGVRHPLVGDAVPRPVHLDQAFLQQVLGVGGVGGELAGRAQSSVERRAATYSVKSSREPFTWGAWSVIPRRLAAALPRFVADVSQECNSPHLKTS